MERAGRHRKTEKLHPGDYLWENCQESPQVFPLQDSQMDELEQKCYDLDAKVRLVEEERDSLMNENEDLQDQINTLKYLVESSALNNDSMKDEPTREEILRLSEEVSRLDTVLAALKENVRTVNDKMKEVGVLKDTVRSISEETSCVKEDFLNLKNHLNIAAKIELQTNEKMYENRLHHLEKMLEEMRHREESFLHIAEETNILKDQVDSLRELSLYSLKSEQSNFVFNAIHQPDNNMPSLNEELNYDQDLVPANRPTSLPISYDSPVTEQPVQTIPPITYDSRSSTQEPIQEPIFAPITTPSGPLKITGQVKLSLSKNPPAKALENVNQSQPSQEQQQVKEEYKFNCCSDLMAKLWVTFFD